MLATCRSALHLAARYGKKDVAELLIDKGADINLNNGWGGTPLSWAKHKGRKGIVELLRKHGANNHDEAVSFEPVPLANQKRTEPHTDAPKMVMNVGVVG